MPAAGPSPLHPPQCCGWAALRHGLAHQRRRHAAAPTGLVHRAHAEKVCYSLAGARHRKRPVGGMRCQALGEAGYAHAGGLEQVRGEVVVPPLLHGGRRWGCGGVVSRSGTTTGGPWVRVGAAAAAAGAAVAHRVVIGGGAQVCDHGLRGYFARKATTGAAGMLAGAAGRCGVRASSRLIAAVVLLGSGWGRLSGVSAGPGWWVVLQRLGQGGVAKALVCGRERARAHGSPMLLRVCAAAGAPEKARALERERCEAVVG
eukprot:851656-Pelagomonas_calceolata.AAC.3